MSPTTPPQFHLKVYIGQSGAKTAIPAELAEALVSAEISVTDEIPSGFQLVFLVQATAEDNDYDLLTDPLLEEFNRVVLEMLVDEQPQVLMDGFVTNKELDQGAGRVVLTGEDLSVKMDLFEVSKSYPSKTDSAIATEVLGRYSSLGFTTEVTAPASEVTPEVYTPQQLSTDRQYLLKLARRNDSRFYIKFDSGAIAYWGPPERDGEPQPALTSHAVMFGNVEKLDPQYNALAGTLFYGSKLADGDSGKESVMTPFGATGFTDTTLSETPAPLAEYSSLATDPGSFASEITDLNIKGKYLRHQHLEQGQVAGVAQAETNLTTAPTATIEGELDTAKYGHVLKVPGIVGVRGAGSTFDGDYYVKSVTHKMNLKRGEVQYMQSFTLTREGVGATAASVDT